MTGDTDELDIIPDPSGDPTLADVLRDRARQEIAWRFASARGTGDPAILVEAVVKLSAEGAALALDRVEDDLINGFTAIEKGTPPPYALGWYTAADAALDRVRKVRADFREPVVLPGRCRVCRRRLRPWWRRSSQIGVCKWCKQMLLSRYELDGENW